MSWYFLKGEHCSLRFQEVPARHPWAFWEIQDGVQDGRQSFKYFIYAYYFYIFFSISNVIVNVLVCYVLGSIAHQYSSRCWIGSLEHYEKLKIKNKILYANCVYVFFFTSNIIVNVLVFSGKGSIDLQDFSRYRLGTLERYEILKMAFKTAAKF